MLDEETETGSKEGDDELLLVVGEEVENDAGAQEGGETVSSLLFDGRKDPPHHILMVHLGDNDLGLMKE